MKLNTAEVCAIKSYAKQDEKLNNELRMLIGRIIYLINLSQEKDCWAHNSYFAKEFNRSERTIKRWLKILKDLGYITIKYVWKGKKIVERVISISAKFLSKILDKAHKKEEEIKNGIGKAIDPGNGLVNNKINLDTKEKKDLLLRNKSKKEKLFKDAKPKNYNEVLKLWADENLKGTARAFWWYNTKRAWANIRNWKRAAIGWAKKTKDNSAAFKADKTKLTEPYTTDYERVLPDLSYNTWDML